MGIHVNIGQAKTRLSELVAASLRGEDVVLSKAGKPVVRLTAIEDAAVEAARREIEIRAAAMRRTFGSLKDKFPPGAGDLFLEPEYGDDEIDGFTRLS
jgi:prevent-host-death family protein